MTTNLDFDWICRIFLKMDQKDIDENKRRRKFESIQENRMKKLKRILNG